MMFMIFPKGKLNLKVNYLMINHFFHYIFKIVFINFLLNKFFIFEFMKTEFIIFNEIHLRTYFL
jgi:hypothetical protein